MTSPSTHAAQTTSVPSHSRGNAQAHRRVSTETKAAFKTTEFLAYLATVVAIIVTAQVVGDDSNAGNDGDYFRADKAMLFIVVTTVGYLVSRGLAKSGSRDFYDDTVDLRDTADRR